MTTGSDAIAVNLHPRVWFSTVWSEDGRPEGLDDWTEAQMTTFADMLGTAHPAVIAEAIGRPLRELLWFEHQVVIDNGEDYLP